MNQDIAVAGIDIGGDRKGCHLVILRGMEVACSTVDHDPDVLARLCKDHDVIAVGVDSPCKWGSCSGGRKAERCLAKQRIFSFSTPTKERALANKSGFYGWMFNGERVYEALLPEYPLLSAAKYTGGRICFETFPHAVTCALLGVETASAKKKRTQRRQLLENAGIATRSLRNPLKSIDAIDAALCALTAQFLIENRYQPIGDPEGGWIVMPSPLSR